MSRHHSYFLRRLNSPQAGDNRWEAQPPDSGSRGPVRVLAKVNCAVFLSKTLYFHNASLHPGKPDEMLGGGGGRATCDGLASHPGGVAILLVVSCYGNRNILLQLWTTKLMRTQ